MAKPRGPSCLSPSMGMGECTTRAASGAASERAACESLNLWCNKLLPQKAEEASCQESRLQSKLPTSPYAKTTSPRGAACVGRCCQALSMQIPGRTTKCKWYSSWISQGTTAAFRHSQFGLHFSKFLRHG